MILAIDPGSRVSSMVWLRDDLGRVVHSEVDMPNEAVLAILHGRPLRLWVKDGGPVDEVVIETFEPRGERLGHDVVDTILWIGRFQEASGGELLGRSKVWKHLCGKDRDDAAIRRVLLDKLGPQTIERWETGPKGGKKKILDPGPTYGVKSHAWQALGLAVTYAETVLKKGGE